jgi:flagellar assembly factor FliW
MSTQMQPVSANDPFLPVESEILGHLSVPETECLTFSDGILGFPACRRFVLVPTSRPELFWLQSMEHGSLAFLLADPFALVEGFSVDLPEAELAALRPSDPKKVGVLAIVTLPRSAGEAATANLQGLLAINFGEGLGKQIVLPESTYGIRWPIDLQNLRLAS